MTVRPLRESDIPALGAMADACGYPYPDLRKGGLEAVLVVADDEDRPVMACAAERLVQVYLWCGDFERPLAKSYAVRLLHDAMAEELRAKGYRGAEAFIPPTLASAFGRRLEKTFGWVRNWPSWNRRF